MSEKHESGTQRKPCVCDLCGFAIKDGVGMHEDCEDRLADEPLGPARPGEVKKEIEHGWNRCPMHGQFRDDEKMCPDCYQNAKVQGEGEWVL